ncbi:MAG TPA: hypothetical protein DEP35_10805 [Deltaproteobacteria bacterium]|nr:hypothetical protein [Deltaproteobacteria bacterium]
MGYSKALIVGLGLAAALGCTGVVGKVKRALRSPGEELVTMPADVWSEYKCGEQRLPFFRLEQTELIPERVTAGDDVNHRMVYALCPTEPTAVIEGTLQTRILFKGKPVARDANDAYDIKPGRWVVDTFIQIPPQAETGIYSVEVQFLSQTVNFREERSFAVKGNPK